MKQQTKRDETTIEMRRMREQQGKTQSEIASHFKISRQRVSQIIGQKIMPKPNYRQLKDVAWWEENKHRTTMEIATEFGCVWQTVQRWRKRAGVGPVPNTAVRVGESGELLVVERLRGLGFEPTHFPGRHPFDIEVAGKHIDVKTSSPRPVSITHPSPRYSFAIKAAELDEVDFYVFVVKHPDDWACFVVPIAVLADGRTAVQFPWPAHNPIENPWVKYLERWDLLDIL